MGRMEEPMITSSHRRIPVRSLACLAAFGFAFAAPASRAATAGELLSSYAAQAGQAPSPARGEQFFTARHGREWSCASCHGAPPTSGGKHAVTGKSIEPLAPAANPARFTDAAKSEKWFRRNCNDVVGRECSAAEKADVLSWLQGLRR
jgi:hypothetical protein